MEVTTSLSLDGLLAEARVAMRTLGKVCDALEGGPEPTDRPDSGERGERAWISHHDAVEAVAALCFDPTIEDAFDEAEAWKKARSDARDVLSNAERLRTGDGGRSRDLLWCEALTQTLDPQEMQKVLSYFNEHRPDQSKDDKPHPSHRWREQPDTDEDFCGNCGAWTSWPEASGVCTRTWFHLLQKDRPSSTEGGGSFTPSEHHPATEFGECTQCGEVFGRARGETWVQCRDCRPDPSTSSEETP